MTRYPKAGKGRPWTVRELSSTPAAWAGDTISDGGGLSGEVRVGQDSKVSIRFKYAYKWEGKVRWYQCGTWPLLDLAEIRAARDDAKAKVKAGINPAIDKLATKVEALAAREAVIAEAKRQKAENLTVQDLFDIWIIDGINRKDGNKEMSRMFKRDILLEIGATALRDLTEAALRTLLRKVLAEGTISKAIHMLLGIKQMLAWGEKRQPWRALLIEGNPADLITEDSIVPPDYEEERTRILSPDEIQELHDIFDTQAEAYEVAEAGTKYQYERALKKENQLALWICLGTLCRIGELSMAEWRHVNFKTRIWFIPKENVKGRRSKRQNHYIYLSNFSLRLFEALYELTGNTTWCLPGQDQDDVEVTHISPSTISKQVGDRQEMFMERKPLKGRKHNNTLVLADGKSGNWTPHDMRRTGATMMQSLGISLDVIDRCQNHVIKGSKVRRSYLHYDYADEKADAWSKLGKRLDEILAEERKTRSKQWIKRVTSPTSLAALKKAGST